MTRTISSGVMSATSFHKGFPATLAYEMQSFRFSFVVVLEKTLAYPEIPDCVEYSIASQLHHTSLPRQYEVSQHTVWADSYKSLPLDS